MHRFAWTRAWRRVAGPVALVAILSVATDRAMAGGQGTLLLDSDSYLSYGESQNSHIASGSTIRFRFGAASADGSVPISVYPEDVSIAPIPVAEGLAIQYALARVASGTLRNIRGSKQIELFATLVATLQGSAETPPAFFELRFTTGTAQASNARRTATVAIDGTPVEAGNHVRLVGAATNRQDAFPGPGEAVYAILSGSFDWLPEGP